MIETLTVRKTVELLREHGMRISIEALEAGLVAGVYPFGDYYKMPSGAPRYTIYKRLLLEWIAAREN